MDNLIGKRFGNLFVIKRAENNKHGNLQWLCKCSCGKEKIIRGNHLKQGLIQSCGCLYKKNKNALKHGYTRSKIYNIFNAMLNRCNNLNHEYYKNYGGRGITVCNRWSNKKNGFENFLEDMGKPPSAKHQIDRIDNNLGYYKENCHWVLSKNNNRNKRNNRFFTYNGKTQCLIDWAKEYKINYVILWCRIYRHRWLIEKALTVSVRKCEGERNNGKY